jgi:hypothetical protein
MKESPNKIYFENLDGWRAIAAFAVIFAHLSYQIKPNEPFAFLIGPSLKILSAARPPIKSTELESETISCRLKHFESAPAIVRYSSRAAYNS